MNSLKRLQTVETEEAYQEGYNAGSSRCSEESNPHSDLAAEFWSDGWEAAVEDNLCL